MSLRVKPNFNVSSIDLLILGVITVLWAFAWWVGYNAGVDGVECLQHGT